MTVAKLGHTAHLNPTLVGFGILTMLTFWSRAVILAVGFLLGNEGAIGELIASWPRTW
ncbi:hypothetical protein [Gemmatimonas sp.]|uniref:hypothetical protein n=1 Tax=Gemmatimonas sp. TaxID=1962908 RepID=UPI003982F0ED